MPARHRAAGFAVMFAASPSVRLRRWKRVGRAKSSWRTSPQL